MSNALRRFVFLYALAAFALTGFAVGIASTRSVTVATTPTRLVGATDQSERAAIIFNNGSNTIYVGTRTVTTSIGVPVAAGGALTVKGGVELYGVVASSTENARVMEVSP